MKPVTRIVVLLALGALAGCSSVPNAVNPVEWYKGASDFLTGKNTAGRAKAPENGLVADKNAPKPKSVKNKPTETPAAGLNSANGDQAYASAPIPRQSAPTSVLSDAPPMAEAPAPTAQPVIAVTPEPIAPLGQTPPSSVAQAAPSASPRAAPIVQGHEMQVPAAPAGQGAMASGAPSPVSPLAAASNEYGTVVIDGATAGRTAPKSTAAETTARKLAELSGGGDAGAAGPYRTVVISSDGVDTANLTEPSGIVMPSHKGKLLFPSTAATQARPGTHKRIAKDGTLKVASILFANDSSGLDARDLSILKAVRQLHEERGGTLRVVGHASSRTANMDPIRHKMLNFKLSVERADHVARELISLGVPKDAVQIVAVSDTDPLYYEVMPSGEAGNRRAEVFLVK